MQNDYFVVKKKKYNIILTNRRRMDELMRMKREVEDNELWNMEKMIEDEEFVSDQNPSGAQN
jgi:hypothetical protein